MRTNILRQLPIALLIVSLTVSTSVAFFAPFDDSLAAYDRGDFTTAVRLLRPLAEQGDAQAKNALGAMYYNGKGVARDFKEALKWYRSAAAQGNLSAQVNLASMYYEGEGIAVDLIRSYMWMSLAAAQNNADATRMRETVSKYLTAPQLAEARAMAQKCQASNYKQCD